MSGEIEPRPSAGWSRRRFLTAGGAAVVVGYETTQAPLRWAMQPASLLGRVEQLLLGSTTLPPKTFTLDFRRREDLVHLSYDFYNLHVSGTPSRPVLTKVNPALDALIVVRFPAQHLLEEAFVDFDPANPGQPPSAPPVQSRLTAESRLAFTIPNSLLPMTYDDDHLLNWRGWQPRVVPVAGGPKPLLNFGSGLRAPGAAETAIELPWFLVLSPDNGGQWRHHALPPTGASTDGTLTRPVTHNGRTDLFQTTLLGFNIGTSGATSVPAVRAVWDFDADHAPGGPKPNTTKSQPFLQPLNPLEWWQIVQNSSVRSATYTPTPVRVNRLSLSSLGGYFDAVGDWPTGSTDLKEWRQRTYLGRDAFVKTTEKGFLYPFGIPALLVKITERKLLNPDVSGRPIAYLRQRQFLVVNQDTLTFGGSVYQTPQGPRQVPFTQLRSVTDVTPNIDLTSTGEPVNQLDPTPSGVAKGELFMPVVDGAVFNFHFQGLDFAGHRIDFTSPAVFTSGTVAFDMSSNATLAKLVKKYDENPESVRQGSFHGAKVAFADPGGKDGSTTHEVKTMTWASHTISGSHTIDALRAANQPGFWLSMAEAGLRLTPAEQVSGASLGSVPVAFHKQYVDQGMGVAAGNKGEVYLRPKSPPPLKFKGDSCGAVALPNIGIVALSRLIGPVGGSASDSSATDDAVDTAQDGTFDPQAFFKDSDAKILGAVELWRIVEASGDQTDITNAPQIGTTQTGEVVTTSLHFEPVPKKDETGFAGVTCNFFVPDAEGAMSIDARVTQDLASTAPATTVIDGIVTNFTMFLLGDGTFKFVGVHFSQLSFHSETGQSGTVDPHIDATAFYGPMSFIEELQNFLNFGGGGPAISITPTQVSAELSIPIPNIPLGLFSLENLSFTAGLIIPFVEGSTTLSFAFCSQDNPFHLTISFFGGGGWFGLTLDMGGIKSFEVGLEFGASAAIDLGVACGEVHIWAGIYFKMENVDKDAEHVTLQGYVRAGGSVEVLEIASVSMEAYVGFLFDDNAGVTKVGGEASLTLTVSVLCFSGSVSASWKQYFGGSGDPTFADLFPPDQVTIDPLTESLPPAESDWTSAVFDEYCAAFG